MSTVNRGDGEDIYTIYTIYTQHTKYNISSMLSVEWERERE